MISKIKYSFSLLLFWVVWATMNAIILHRLGFDWETSVWDAVVSNGILAFLCLDMMAIFYFYQPAKENHYYYFIISIGFAILYGLVTKWALGYTIYTAEEGQNFLLNSMSIRFVIALLILLFVTALFWLRNIIEEQQSRSERENDMEKYSKEAELATLRQQIQPHFLFNSLNSISALIAVHPEKARTMVQQLSDFLRGTIKKDHQQFNSLKEEAEHLRLYLEIEKVRFGYRLDVVLDFDEVSLSAQLPTLLIQPVVENAIKFGLYDTTEKITISIQSKILDNTLFVTVKNPFDRQSSSYGQGTGFGLSFIQRRLFLLYARNDLLKIEKDESYFKVTIKIPQQS